MSRQLTAPTQNVFLLCFYPVFDNVCLEFHEKVLVPWILLLIVFSLMVVLVCRNNLYPLPSVLQFVPQNVDVGFCSFSRRIEKGLTTAFMEVSKHQEFYNFTVQVRRSACFVSVPFSPHLWLSCVSSSQ